MSCQPFFANFHQSNSHSASKRILFLYLLPFFTLSYQLLLSNFSWRAQLSNIILITLAVTSFSTFLRLRSWAYGLWSTILVSIVPLILVLMTSEFQFYFLGYSFINPLLILILSNNQLFCFISYVIQICVLNFYARNISWEHNFKFDAEEFGSKLTETLTVLVFNSTVILGIIYFQNKSVATEQSPLQQSNEPIQRNSHHDFLFEIRDFLNSLHGSLQIINSKLMSLCDQEMLRIAKLSTENIQRLFNNMVDLFELETEIPGVILNYADSHCYFRNIWDIISASMQRRGQEGAFKILRNLPKTIKIDPHRTKQLILNLSEFLIHSNNSKTMNINIDWINRNLKSIIREELFDGKAIIDGISLDNFDSVKKTIAQQKQTQMFNLPDLKETQGVLKLKFVVAGSYACFKDMGSVLKSSKERTKTTAEIGFNIALKISKILEGSVTLDVKEDYSVMTAYLPCASC